MRVLYLLALLHALLPASNWLMLQGTQKKVGHTPFAFIQTNYEENSGDIVIDEGINRTPFSYLPNRLQSQSQIALSRFRIGLRGTLDKQNKINYFLLTEFAPNGINNPLGEREATYITDASITLRYLPINFRFGKFRYPGSEEGMAPRMLMPFINFTNVSNHLMLERFVRAPLSRPIAGVGAYRDSGMQIFQSYSMSDDSELTLAYMYGLGSGTSNRVLNGYEPTHYGYLSYEKILGKGAGYNLESLKLYAWMQSGKRYLASQDEYYRRDRSGLGLRYYYDGLRLEAEYMQGAGMITNGVVDTNPDPKEASWSQAISAQIDSKADGYYTALTYEPINKLEILARYDRYDRMTNNKNLYRVFETLTMGTSYRFEKFNRIDLNYSLNSISAPNNSRADELLKASGNILSIQLTLIFN